MSQTLVKNYLHIIFSTRQRIHAIPDDVAPNLYSYIAGICNKLNCIADNIGGHKDHIHILCRLPKTVRLSDLVLEIKTASSIWIKTQPGVSSGFHWQKGYAAFSISDSDFDQVYEYITNQRQHHLRRSFREELELLLVANKVSFDDRYLWTD